MIYEISSILTANDLEVSCPECGVLYMTAYGRVTCDEQCMELFAKRKKIKLDDTYRDRRENEAVKWRGLGVPGSFMHAEPDHLDREHHWQTRQSVRIMGAAGRGKTHAAVVLLKTASGKGASARFVSAANYLKAVKATYRKGSRESEADVLADYTRPDVLVLDDVGAAKNSEHGWAELLSLLEQRGWGNKTTIITTNLTMAEIHEHEPRVASRLRGWRVIELTGADRRVAP